MHKKAVLVTGASRGIGRAIAMTFAQNNYHVFLNCRHSISELESVKSAIEATPYGSCDIFDRRCRKSTFCQRAVRDDLHKIRLSGCTCQQCGNCSHWSAKRYER